MPGARRFAEHGAVSEGRELPQLEQVTVSARRVQLAEVAAGEDEIAPAEELAAPRRLFAAD
jgi:hypothetical protein